MKKSLANTAVAIALSSALFSGTVLASKMNVAAESSATTAITDNSSHIDNTTETYFYPGMSVGAVTGTLLAGPVGFVVGGLIGAIVGVNQTVSTSSAEALPMTDNNIETTAETNSVTNSVADFNNKHNDFQEKPKPASIQLAQIGTIPSITDETIHSQVDTILDILTTDLSLDIYFRSGSSNIESFYPVRIKAIAELMSSIDELEIHLDGYSDRRGNKINNMALANERINNVRERLINAGVDHTRIISKAFGEMKMVSVPGDLEAYTFDRKVVIRFQRSAADSIHAMTQILSETQATTTADIVVNSDIETVAIESATRF